MTVFRSLFFIVFIALFSACKSSLKLFAKGEVAAEPFDKTVPVTKNKGLLIVPVQIAGETYHFLFDTGAPMAISTELQAKLQCKRLAKKTVGDSQGRKKQLDYVQLPTVELAGQGFTNLTAIVTNLIDVPAIGCLKIDGIIGANLMRLAFWEIDAEANLMRFTNVWENIKTDSSANHVNFNTKATGTPVIPELFLDSVLISNVTFDTGSAGMLGVPRKMLPEIHTDSSLKSAYGHLSSGLYGSSLDTNYYVQKTLWLGSDTIRNFPFELQSERNAKLLGMRYFKNYRMVLNWNEKKVYLHKKQDVNPSDFKSFGISFTLENEHIVVASLFGGSAAQRAGIEIGDTLIRVNEFHSPITQADDYCQMLQDLYSNDNLAFEIKGKGSFNLKKEPIYREENEN